MKVRIRQERPGDAPAVRAVNEAAFDGPTEAGIVDRLRERCPRRISLVAEAGERIVGHVLFTPAAIEGEGGAIQGMALAPMAVIPQCQRRGVGRRLVEAGLAALRRRGCPFVVVVGHAEYYGRFGFAPAARHGVRCRWEGVPEESFMLLILDASPMAGVSGLARYRDEFDETT